MADLSYVIDFFTPDDAPGVVSLFRHVYGEHFPVRTVYDPEELIKEEKTGETYRLIARSPSGEIVGHLSVYRSTSPNPSLYEAGCLMVHTGFRQTPLSFALATALKTMLIGRHHITQLWFETVCNHLFTQQEAQRLGLTETSLEMDLMPAEAYATPGAQSSGGRVSVLTSFLLLSTEPQTLYLPSVYEQFIRQLYAPLDLDRTFLIADTLCIPPGKTTGQSRIFSEAGLVRITLDTAGEDFPDWIDSAMHAAEQEGVVVFQVFLQLTQPYAGWVVGQLTARGFFIGGILPVWFGADGLLMQKTAHKPFFEGTYVFSRHAKMMKEYVQNDWRKQNPG
jgi:hypothetical protein